MKKIETIDKWSDFQKIINQYDCVVVMAKASWCSHCHQLSPIFEKAFQKAQCNNVICVYFDSETSKESIGKLPINVSGFPTTQSY